MSAGTASGWFQFPREDAQGTTEPRLLFSFWIRFNSPEKMLRGQHQRLTVLPHLSVSIPPRRCSGDNRKSHVSPQRGAVSIPPRRCSGDNSKLYWDMRRSQVSIPPRRCSGDNNNKSQNRRGGKSFNSPEKMLRGQLIPDLSAFDNMFQFPREDAQGTTSMAPSTWNRGSFNSPEKMLRGQQRSDRGRHRLGVSIPPRRCSGDNHYSALILRTTRVSIPPRRCSGDNAGNRWIGSL